jgi:hypothetical protein
MRWTTSLTDNLAGQKSIYNRNQLKLTWGILDINGSKMFGRFCIVLEN